MVSILSHILFVYKQSYLKQVEEFVYLGSDINKEDRIQEEISRRMQSGAKCYHLIKHLLWNQDIPLNCIKKKQCIKHILNLY